MTTSIRTPHPGVDISELPEDVSMYLVMWDNTGLEFLYNLSKWDKMQVWSELIGQPNPIERPPHPGHLIMRARYNPQRHYEIYTFTVDKTLSEDDLRQQFADSPQSIVDLIRANGNCLFSERVTQKPVIV